MRRRFFVRTGTSLGVILMFVFGTSLTTYAQCLGSLGSMRVSHGGYRGTDGNIHYRLRKSCGLPTGVANAIAAAVDDWNQSGSIKLDLLDCGSPLEVDFFIGVTEDDAYTGGCAGVQNGEFIWVDISGVSSWAASYPDLAKMIMAHEVGHSLGLDDLGVGGWSIMNNPFWAGSCLSSAMNYQGSGAQMGPTGQDRINVDNCGYASRVSTGPIREEPGYNHWTGGPQCYDTWIIWTWYSCTTSACWPIDEQWEYVGFWCGLTGSCD